MSAEYQVHIVQETQFPKKVRKGLRLFPIEKTGTWKVGRDLGNSIRSAHFIAGGKKSPHLRRAHWHHFWTGKCDAENRKLSFKLLFLIFIGDAPKEFFYESQTPRS